MSGFWCLKVRFSAILTIFKSYGSPKYSSFVSQTTCSTYAKSYGSPKYSSFVGEVIILVM